MHFPIEFLLLGLVGEGSRWIGNKGWLPPGGSFISRGKTGYLDQKGIPDISPEGKPYSAKEKEAIMKKEEQMINKEMGFGNKTFSELRKPLLDKRQEIEDRMEQAVRDNPLIKEQKAIIAELKGDRTSGATQKRVEAQKALQYFQDSVRGRYSKELEDVNVQIRELNDRYFRSSKGSVRKFNQQKELADSVKSQVKSEFESWVAKSNPSKKQIADYKKTTNAYLKKEYGIEKGL
jgi:hypothetical protein